MITQCTIRLETFIVSCTLPVLIFSAVYTKVKSKLCILAKVRFHFSILSMLTRQLINIPVHLGLDHLPNIYCGVAVFVLLPLYIMCSKVNAREKIGKCVILLIFLTAFNLNIPNYIWHGMHFPNSLPCRQSFIYIFFLLAMCYEAVINLKNSTNKQLGASLWIAIGLLLIMEELLLTLRLNIHLRVYI